MTLARAWFLTSFQISVEYRLRFCCQPILEVQTKVHVEGVNTHSVETPVSDCRVWLDISGTRKDKPTRS